jgi:cation diffusion facilitator family transporter
LNREPENIPKMSDPESYPESISNPYSGVKVTVIGAVVNLILAIFKFVIGTIGNSKALIADAVHSISDLATDIIVLLGLHFGNLPADQNHHYGHKKIETVAEIALGLFLIIVAVKLAYDSGVALWFKKIVRPKSITIVAAIVSIISKELLYRWTKNVGQRVRSGVIIANAWHHRTDAYSSIAVLVGLVFTRISSTLVFMDAVASLVVSILILKVAWGIVSGAFKRIIDTAPPIDYIEETLKLIRSYPGVKNPHNLKMRYIGYAIHMEVHIEVDPDISVKQGHDIAAGVKYMIKNHHKNVMDVIVHVEPFEE